MDESGPNWMRFLRGMSSTLKQHSASPEIPCEAYVRQRKLEHGKQVLQKRRIYLDMKYWIYFRDVERGNPQKVIHKEILRVLRQAVRSGGVLCPVSHIVFEETTKQLDHESRAATAKVIDDLSGNVAIEFLDILTNTEIVHFLKSCQVGESALHPLIQLVWSFVGCLYGLQLPLTDAFDAATLNALRKSIFDDFARMPMSALVSAWGELPAERDGFDEATFQVLQTAEARAHRGDFKTFHEVFMIEVMGILDVLRPHLHTIMVHEFESATGRVLADKAIEANPRASLDFAGLIYSAFANNKVSTQLPGIHILAGLYAAKRYQPQSFRKGDMHDHLHARIALPYCDMFLTERGLGNLLTGYLLKYDVEYGCRVLWKDEEILAALRSL